MAIWTKELTWQYNINQATAAGADIPTDASAIMSKIVTSLIAMAGLTVFSCSDGSGAAPSNALRWDTPAKVIGAADGVNHSWIVLTSTAGGWQLCIMMNNVNEQSAKFVLSPGSLFVAGTAVNNPAMPADAITVLDGGWYGAAGVSATKTHVMMDTTAASIRALVYGGGNIYSCWLIETAADPVPTSTPWSVPVVGYITSNTAKTWTNIKGTNWKTRWNGTNYTMSMTVEMSDTNLPVPQVNAGIPNDTVTAYVGSPMGLWCATAGFRGKQGRLRDLWLGSNAVATADSYPVAQPDFVQVGELIFPWDGVNAMQIT